MNLLQRNALNLYYLATQSSRQRAANQRAVDGTEPVQVVFYHRVAKPAVDDWTIEPEMFARHLSWMEKRFEIVGLAEGQRRIASGNNRQPTVCITFDDGYGDNCETAIPLLFKRGHPFTYFVASDYVLRGRPFPHDLHSGLIRRPNTINELKELAAAGVEIGSHTRNHTNLGKAESDYFLYDELARSKCDLQQVLDTEVRYFAFPFGMPEHMSTEAFRVAAEVGYDGACSAYGGYNFPGDDAFHIRRFHGDRDMVRLKNWLTIDPRKLSGITFDPGTYRPAESTLV